MKFIGAIKNKLLRYLPLYQWYYVKRLRFKKEINVVFFAASLPMWRYQHVYEELCRHPRFKTWIVIAPASAFSNTQKAKDIEVLEDFFTKKNIPFLIGWDGHNKYLDVKKELNPDILFYPQPYRDFYPENDSCERINYFHFYDRLLCYCPYAFWSTKGDWAYDLPLHRYAWKLFYSTELHKQEAKRYGRSGNRNVEVVGYPNADDFLSGNYKDIWKPQDVKRKRIIYAPHFTIFKGGLLEQSNFLWLGEFMQEVAKLYADRIQFVFKPHPRLYTELCEHEEWGEEKTNAYYEAWKTMDNTQLQTGEFVDLFMTSDAMIHDSGSFSVEYHYSGKPVMYVADNIEEQILNKNELGEKAMRLHYIAKTKQDIIDFIENVVLNGEDPMKQGREQFKQDYLLPPNGKTVAQNMADVLIKAFC